MTILAFDFTSPYGSVAIHRDGCTILDQDIYSTEGFDHLVFPAIDELLQRANMQLTEIDCFASANGPGAFTGVRVGLAVVKGLAEALGKQAAGVSNLRALAFFGATPTRAVVLDARRDEVFSAIYNATLRPLADESVGKLTDFLSNLSDKPGEIITPAATWLRSSLEGTRWEDTPVTEAPRTLAPAIAHCAELDLRSGISSDPGALDANYVRRSDAERIWKDI